MFSRTADTSAKHALGAHFTSTYSILDLESLVTLMELSLHDAPERVFQRAPRRAWHGAAERHVADAYMPVPLGCEPDLDVMIRTVQPLACVNLRRS